MTLPRRPFGSTGLRVSALGLGAGRIGDESLGEPEVAALLDAALEAGINLIDTARSYGASEERIGRHLAGRRDGLVLSTKIGYGVPGIPDWTPACIEAGVDAALGRLRTDRIDIVHLHSCPLEVLRREEIVGALARARDAGKVSVVAYAGDGEALDHAVGCGAFGAVQASSSICDRAAGPALSRARAAGLGTIAKRPLANAPWRFGDAAPPPGDDAELYWRRWRQLAIDPGELDWPELALRFTLWHTPADAAIVGTASIANLRANAAAAARGPLPPALLEAVTTAWSVHGAGWPGKV